MSDGAARVGLQLGGAAIGGILGGPAGAQAGLVLGSLAGAILFPPQSPTPPDLSDDFVPKTPYGAPVPIVIGTRAVQCKCIWFGDVRTDVEGGGGGFFSSEPEVRKYYTTAAFSVCDVPEGYEAQIIRVWADHEVVYNLRNASVSSEFSKALTFYNGHQTQPDATMESRIGVGKLPSYERHCYFVLDDWDITPFGPGRVPTLRAEVSVRPSGNSESPLTGNLVVSNPGILDHDNVSSHRIIQNPAGDNFVTFSANGDILYEIMAPDGTRLKTSTDWITDQVATSGYGFAFDVTEFGAYVWEQYSGFQRLRFIPLTYHETGLSVGAPITVFRTENITTSYYKQVEAVKNGQIPGSVTLLFYYTGADYDFDVTTPQPFSVPPKSVVAIGFDEERQVIISQEAVPAPFEDVENWRVEIDDASKVGLIVSQYNGTPHALPFRTELAWGYDGLGKDRIGRLQGVIEFGDGLVPLPTAVNSDHHFRNCFNITPAKSIGSGSQGFFIAGYLGAGYGSEMYWQGNYQYDSYPVYLRTYRVDRNDLNTIHHGNEYLVAGGNNDNAVYRNQPCLQTLSFSGRGALLFSEKYAVNEAYLSWSYRISGVFFTAKSDLTIESREPTSPFYYIDDFYSREGGNEWSFEGTKTAILTNREDQYLAFVGRSMLDNSFVDTQFGTLLPVIIEDEASVSEMINFILERAGFPLQRADTSGLSSDKVIGYAITKQTTARQAISPILETFDQQGFDRGDKLIFRDADPTRVATIATEDMAARANPSRSVGDEIEITYIDESEMPQTTTVTYVDKERDYAANTQRAQRTQHGPYAKRVQQIELPFALQNGKAANIAERLHWERWAQNARFRFQVPFGRYPELLPYDTVFVEINNNDIEVAYIDRIDTGESGIVDIEALRIDSDGYDTENAVAGVANGPDSVVGKIIQTRPIFMNLPTLTRDMRNTPVGAVAMAGVESGWGGGVLYRDYGAGNASKFVSVPPDGQVLGSTEGQLASGPWLYRDLENSFTVRLYPYMTLTSTTQDGIDVGENLAYVGGELLQFQDAVDNGDGTWTLSTLTRGLYGTETELENHLAGEAFVLLPFNRRDIPVFEVDEKNINAPTSYLVATAGQPLFNALAASYRPAGRNLKPLAPAHSYVVPKGGGGLDVYWTRRARYGADLGLPNEVPLAEAEEKYEIDVIDPSDDSVKRTLTSTSSSVTYTASQRSSDFGTVTGNIDFRIYQMSETVGRGFPATYYHRP